MCDSHLPPPKTWAALSRRNEGEPPFDFLVDLCLQSLITENDMGIISYGVMLPHTIVYRQASQVKWYYTSPTHGIVAKKPSQITTTAIRRALFVQGAPEGPIAVWHSERKDAKGYLYTQEFLDEKGLAMFLKHRTDRGKCGVLQKFILPKDIKGKEGVNHELLVHSDTYLSIERRFNNLSLEPTKSFGTTQQSCVHSCITTAGKLNLPPSAVALPYQPSDLSVGYDEMQSSTLLSVLGPAVKFIHTQLCTLRHPEAVSAMQTPDREMSCLFKVDRQNQLWLLGFGHVRSPEKGIDWIIPDFEFIKKKRKRMGSEEEKAPLDFNFALGAEARQDNTEVQKQQTIIKKVVQVKKPQADMFSCPNCRQAMDKDQLCTTTYLSILRYFDRRTKQQQKCVKGTTTLDNSSPQSPFAYPDSGAFLDTSHNWVTIPPILQRLSKSIDELRTNDTWLKRQVNLCKSCYTVFYNPNDENEQLQQCFVRELEVKKTHKDRVPNTWYWVAERGNPVDKRYPLVNDMVFTGLQEHHRGIQLKTRQKLHQRYMLYKRVASPEGQSPAAAPAPPRDEKPPGYTRVQFGSATMPVTSASVPVVGPSEAAGEEGGDVWLAKLRELEQPGPAGTEMDSTVSTVLCNQLFEQLTAQLSFGKPCEGEEDVPSDHRLYSVYGKNKNRIPPPDPRIELTVLPTDDRVIKEREAKSHHHKHRHAMYGRIAEILPIFSTLSNQEKNLFLDVVSTSHGREKPRPSSKEEEKRSV